MEINGETKIKTVACAKTNKLEYLSAPNPYFFVS